MNAPQSQWTQKAQSLHQLNSFAVLRHMCVPAKLFFDVTGHRICGLRLAVRQERLPRHTSLHAFQPAQNLSPISVRRETANLGRASTYRNPLP